VSGVSSLQGLHQRCELGVATDKAGKPASRGRLQAPPNATGAHQLKDLHRRVEPFNGHWPERGGPDVAFRQPQRRGGDQDGARLGHLLHAGSEVRRLPYGRVIHVQVAANRPHDDFPGIEAHADLDRHALRPLQRVAVAGHALLHGQRRIASAYRVILMRDWSTEERHNAIAHDLVHRTFILVDGSHHAVEHRIEQVPRLLGVALGQQLHRPLEVGEEYRDLLALAFQGAAGGEDFLGQIGGRIGQWGLRRWLRCGHGIGGARPDEDPPVLLHRDASHLDEFGFQIVEVIVVEIELALEGTIREALVLMEPVANLCEDLFEGHRCPSAPRIALQYAFPGAYLTRTSTGTPCKATSQV
jgi:hypothetical protein